MATNTLAPHYEDNDMDRKDLADFAKQSLDRAMDTNHSVAMRQMEVLSMQADETQALLQSGNLTDEQFDKVMQELMRKTANSTSTASRAAIQLDTCVVRVSKNWFVVVGTCQK